MQMIKKFALCLLFIALICCLAACGAGNKAKEAVKREDPHIMAVKEGSPVAYPDKTYGEAFDVFFDSPGWEYFKSSDDDSDVVEFTGYCLYQDVQVQACLQFTLDMDDGSFETTYLSFNDVPQTKLMIAALMEAAFTNEELDEAADGPSEPDKDVDKPPETDTPDAGATTTLAGMPFLGDYEMLSEYDDMGAILSLYSESDRQVYVEGYAYYDTHVGEVFGALEIVDGSYFYLEDNGNRLDMTYDPESRTLDVKETGSFGGIGVTFEGVYAESGSLPESSPQQDQIERADIEELLAADVPSFVAVAGPDVSISWESENTAFISVPLVSAIPEAFTVSGTVDILAGRDNTGKWSAEAYQKNCEISYNYAGSYAENDLEVRFCHIESEVTVGAGCALIEVMPSDETAGGSDPTGSIHVAYLDYCTRSAPAGAVYVLKTSYDDIQVFMDAQMKPTAVVLPLDIWSIP